MEAVKRIQWDRRVLKTMIVTLLVSYLVFWSIYLGELTILKTLNLRLKCHLLK